METDLWLPNLSKRNRPSGRLRKGFIFLGRLHLSLAPNGMMQPLDLYRMGDKLNVNHPEGREGRLAQLG